MDRSGEINIFSNNRRMSENLFQALTEPYNIWVPIVYGESHAALSRLRRYGEGHAVLSPRDSSTHPMYLPPEDAVGVWIRRPLTRATMGYFYRNYAYTMRMVTRFRVWARRAMNRLMQRQYRQALVLTRRYRPGITLLGKRPR